MALSRRSRRASAVLAVLAFVFAQLALSAFACPMEGGEPAIEMTANLCQMHETYGDASADTSVPAPLPMAAAPVMVLLVVPPPQVRVVTPERTALGSGPPPPLIGTVVLRI